jgi:aspartate aminotransferase-like enzyme
MTQPITHHRLPEFGKLLAEIEEGLKEIFQTKNEVLIFASSGTGAMEGAVVNLFSQREKVLVVNTGKFGERFGEICETFGLNYEEIKVEWGKAVEPEVIKERLKEDIKGVFLTHSATSTGIVNDIEAIGKIVKDSPAILIVDAISGLGAINLETDNWNVDVVVAGSQKALMLPPGLAFISLSRKAWERTENSNLPKYYWDFRAHRDSLKKGQTPYTPAISLLQGLGESLRMIKEEGPRDIFARHHRLATATRKGVKALGLELFAEKPVDTVTAVKVPQGIDGAALVKIMRDKYRVIVAGGQARLKGKIFRIAHLGYISRFDILTALSALEMALSELGYKVELGKGVKAAEEILK